MAKKKKLKIGIFSFTGDEGCVIVFEELLNRYLLKWIDFVEFKYARILRSINEIKDIDVAFIEGAIATESEKKKIKKIRRNSRVVVAIGSCAIIGNPSNHRNYFEPERLKEIEFILQRFGHLPKVQPLKDFVRVDATVPGCPMMEQGFIDIMNRYLEEFGVVKGGKNA